MFTINGEEYKLEKYTLKLEYTTEPLDKPFRPIYSNKWLIELIVTVKDTKGLTFEYVYNANTDRYSPIDKPLSCDITNGIMKDYKQFIIDNITYRLSFINLVVITDEEIYTEAMKLMS